MIFPKQEKLRSEVWVCLQNLDELWFVVDGYTCSMFPFEDVKEEFERCLRKALTGEYRIRKFVRRRDGKIFRAYLQQSIGDKWVNVSGYRQIIGFFPTLVYDIRDEFLTTDEAESISSI